MSPDDSGGVPMSLRWFHRNPLQPSGLQVQRLHSVRGGQPYRPLPAPTGMPPYHLALGDVLPPAAMTAIAQAGRMVFHAVGDSGGIMSPFPQQNVARQMESDFQLADESAHPAFFYHLGDVVYFFGESVQYYPQFYEAYGGYPAPIFAIPGNHDGDLSPQMQSQSVPSLQAFVNNFCQRIPYHTADAQDAPRMAMTQPNVYWTLTTPVATFIGLYTNVPDGGQMDDNQIAWLHSELASAPANKLLILSMHHPIYSAETFHSGSAYLHSVLETAVSQSGRYPDIVFTAHVHNYQRFTRSWNGRSVPFIVAGAGGYHNLHTMDPSVKGQPTPITMPGPDTLTLDKFCDDQWGYLRVEASADTLTADYFAVQGAGNPAGATTTHIDSFTVSTKDHSVRTNTVT
jgi:acid phosphatase type 7